MALRYEIAVLFMCIVYVKTEVTVTNAWITNQGWQIKCKWSLDKDDTLQSVRLYSNDQQFMIYRPELEGTHYESRFERQGDALTVNCTQKQYADMLGRCVINMELYAPQTQDFYFNCEVSGERPMFRRSNKTILVQALVPPTRAVIEKTQELEEQSQVMLNCTSSGVPAPKLTWGVGSETIPGAYKGNNWDPVSKLYISWTVLLYKTTSDYLPFCRADGGKDGSTIRGRPTYYSSSSRTGDATIVLYISMLLLLRLW